jgi:hypothetical protein
MDGLVSLEMSRAKEMRQFVADSLGGGIPMTDGAPCLQPFFLSPNRFTKQFLSSPDNKGF